MCDAAEDPFGLGRLEGGWRPARIGSRVKAIDPDSVKEGTFVIVRADASDDEDTSKFTVGGVVDVPLWLFKVRVEVANDNGW